MIPILYINGKNICGHHNQLRHNAMIAIACAIRSSSYTGSTNPSKPFIRAASFRFFQCHNRIRVLVHSMWAYNISLRYRTRCPFLPILWPPLVRTYLHRPPPCPFIICACCSAKRCPMRSLPAMNFCTHRLTQPCSRAISDFVVKSSMQWSKQRSTREENICV